MLHRKLLLLCVLCCTVLLCVGNSVQIQRRPNPIVVVESSSHVRSESGETFEMTSIKFKNKATDEVTFFSFIFVSISKKKNNLKKKYVYGAINWTGKHSFLKIKKIACDFFTFTFNKQSTLEES